MVKINQKVGFRVITKFGQKGIVNLGKLVPGVGAVLSGGFDFAETKLIGNASFSGKRPEHHPSTFYSNSIIFHRQEAHHRQEKCMALFERNRSHAFFIILSD